MASNNSLKFFQKMVQRSEKCDICQNYVNASRAIARATQLVYMNQ